ERDRRAVSRRRARRYRAVASPFGSWFRRRPLGGPERRGTMWGGGGSSDDRRAVVSVLDRDRAGGPRGDRGGHLRGRRGVAGRDRSEDERRGDRPAAEAAVVAGPAGARRLRRPALPARRRRLAVAPLLRLTDPARRRVGAAV